MFLSKPKQQMRRCAELIVWGILISILTFSVGKAVFVFADNTTGASQTLSQTAINREAQKAALQQQLAQVEAELQQLQQNISTQETKKKSLQQQVNIFQNKIAQTRLQIHQLTLAIQQTDLQIQETQQSVNATNAHIDQEKQRLAALLEQISQSDQTSTVQLLLQYNTFSDFFNRAESLQALGEGVRASLLDLQQSMKDLQQKQADLGNQQDSQDNLRQIQTLRQGDLQGQLSGQNTLLTETKGQESRYQALAAQKQETAAQIRNQLFVLQGAGVQLSFGDAYHYASVASGLTGVSPAFLLAELKQESSWGANVGQCYLVDSNTGAGKRKTTGAAVANVMKPSRDVQPFMQITQALGRDPYATQVSCPNPNYGYGGAMGPAQFLPSTWMGYQQSVSSLVGHTADPWDIQDAFVASANKLANAGAAAQTYAAEWKAAMIYYAGNGWNNPLYRSYGDDVMALTAEYQGQIDVLNGSGG